MLICKTFINPLDGATLKKVYSDSNFFIKEKRTAVEYEEAIIPNNRDISEFEETSRIIEESAYVESIE